jgi:putative tricarboxylic transport membrane protein
MIMSKERAASLVLLFSGIYGLIFGLELPLGSLREPGPGMLPICLSSLLTLSGILWFIRRKKERTEKKEGKTTLFGVLGKLTTPLKIVTATGAFILALEPIGYLLTSLIYVFLLFSWISRYRLWMSIGLSLAIGFGSWYFFGRILSVQLPRGFLSL